MKVLIIEDEKPAAEKLTKALLQINEKVNLQAVLGSVHESIHWFNVNALPDLIFMDIALSDGSSFDLFQQVEIKCPVIFTTAYDEYWQEAFEHNGIDYLLKPVKEEKLAAALKKYENLKTHFAANYKLISQLASTNTPGFKKRFLVKKGNDYVSIKADNIAYFYAAHKMVCLMTTEGQKFLLDQSLSDIELQADPSLFYRVNRKHLVNLNAIKRIKALGKGKLTLDLEPATDEEIIVSQESASDFKQWLEQ